MEDENNPLLWWKDKQSLLPLMSRLARRTLNITSGSAPSERTFSPAGLLISARRARLSSDTAAAIMHLYGCWEEVDNYYAQKPKSDIIVLDE